MLIVSLLINMHSNKYEKNKVNIIFTSTNTAVNGPV